MFSYQNVRLTLLNHKNASSEAVLYSLNFLIEKKLIHKEWKRFEFDLLTRYHTALSNMKLPFLSKEANHFLDRLTLVDSISALLELLEPGEEDAGLITVKCLQFFTLGQILSEMDVDQAMVDEFQLYDQMVYQGTKDGLFDHLDNAYEQTGSPEELVSMVMEWYKFIQM